MASEAEKWQERFSREGYWAGTEPAAFVKECLPLLPRGGSVLELAMGEGRNALYLAQQGFHVTGVEQSAAGLDKAEALARERGVHVERPSSGKRRRTPDSPGVLLVQEDLESEALPTGPFDVVVCVNFLLRALLPAISRALRPGGFLLYETYTVEQLNFEGGPRSLEYLLQSGELREAFSNLDLIFFRECKAGKGIASLLARKP